MPQYVVKILVDFEARDDIEARQKAASFVDKPLRDLSEIRDIVLQSPLDHKSIRMDRTGVFDSQWNKGGAAPRGSK